MAKDMQYYYAQLRRIEEHRSAQAEKEIRKMYKEMLKDLQHFISDEYVKLAEDGELTYEILRGKNEYARFLDEVEKRLNKISPKVSREIRTTVQEMYKLSYDGMVDAVRKSTSSDALREAFKGVKGATPETIKAAVENPVSGLTLNDTLEKNRRDIIYNIKKQIGIGLTTGDKMSSMARRIADSLDGDYKKAVRIARTEVHRVREAGHNDCVEEIDQTLQNGATNLRMVKIWRTMKDERVRPQQRVKTKGGWKTVIRGNADHMKMEGQTVLANELFDLGGGLKAKSPGQSGDASNDINCRCTVEYVLMSDEEYFKATGKHFSGAKKEENAQKKDYNLAGSTTRLKASGMDDADYNEYIRILNEHDNESIKELYSKYADGINRVSYTENGGVYRPRSNALEFSYPNERYIQNGQSKYTTLAHEYGHYFDARASYKNTTHNEIDAINDVVGRQMLKHKACLTDKFLSAVRKDKDELKAIGIKTLKQEMKGKDASVGVQDAIDGMFVGAENRISWGHGERYYNRIYSGLSSNDKMFGTTVCKDMKKAYKGMGYDASNQSKVAALCRDYETASEMWANIMSAEICGGEELEYVKKYLPNSYNALIQIVKEVQ